MRKGPKRNFDVFDPLDFLAEVTQHIPNRGEHQIRYYGFYSNKSRGMRREREAKQWDPFLIPMPEPPKRCSATWAMLIKHVYEVDPLACPNCGEQMKVVSLIEARQQDVVQRVLKHTGLWLEPAPRPPPQEPLRKIVREPFYDD
jgi:hypothetical protein